MTTSSTFTSHGIRPLARAAEIDVGILVLGAAAVLLTFLTGQGAANWQNIVFPPIIVALALVTMRLVVAEIRAFMRVPADSLHKTAALLELIFALVAMVIVGPMILIMPFIFFGAIV